MGYPKRYVGRYPFLAKWLVSQGHIVYPMEMICQPVPVKKGPVFRVENVKHPFEYQEIHYLYGAVDVVSMFHGKLWAWEFKSQNDSVKRAALQVENYRRSFDYVSVVVEDLGKLDSVVKKTDLRISTMLKHLGVGIYWLNNGKIELVEAPKLQVPEKALREDLVNRFRRYVCRRPIPEAGQMKLEVSV